MVAVTVDGSPVSVRAGSSVLEAADDAGVYVPRLCAHPSLGTRGRCGVCAVETAPPGIVLACETEVAEGMAIRTDTAAARAARSDALRSLLARHPHVCLTCDLRDGCSRTECSYGVAENQRCCEKFGACEFQKVAAFVGIPDDAPGYEPRDFPTADEKLFTRNPNLCIGCLRCEDACRDIAKSRSGNPVRRETERELRGQGGGVKTPGSVAVATLRTFWSCRRSPRRSQPVAVEGGLQTGSHPSSLAIFVSRAQSLSLMIMTSTRPKISSSSERSMGSPESLDVTTSDPTSRFRMSRTRIFVRPISTTSRKGRSYRTPQSAATEGSAVDSRVDSALSAIPRS